jgi:hypothetical protein
MLGIVEVGGLGRWGWGVRIIFPWAPPGEVTPLHKLCVVDHPERAKVILVAYKALVQREVGADGILDTQQQDEKSEKRESIKSISRSTILLRRRTRDKKEEQRSE